MPFLLALILTLCLVVAGCGSEGEDDENFEAQVTAACTTAGGDLRRQLEPLKESMGSEGSFVRTFDDRYQPILEALLEQLEAVEPPAAAADDYEALLATLEESNAISGDDPLLVAAAAIDPRSPRAERYLELDREVDQLADALGIPSDCGEPPGERAASAFNDNSIGSDPAFVRRGDAICAGFSRQVAAANRRLPAPGEPGAQDAIERFATQIYVPGFRDQIDRLAELRPPQGQEGILEDFLATAREELDAIELDPGRLAERGTLRGTVRLGTRLGISECVGG